MTITKKITDELLLPKDEIKKSFKVLRDKGILYTEAPSVDDVGKKEFPIRMVGQAPAANLKKNEITIGPFPIEKEHYLQLKKRFGSDKGIWATYLSLIKMQYEKIGGLIEGYGIKTDTKSKGLVLVVNLLNLFNIKNPMVFKDFVWFCPNEKCKKIFTKGIKKKFLKDDFSWWNIYINVGPEINLETVDDHSEHFSKIPNNLFYWMKYFPVYIGHIVMRLYSVGSKGLNLKPFSDISGILEIIEKEIDNSKSKRDDVNPDRELLIKELLDYNNIVYPVDAKSVFDFLCRIKIISVQKTKSGIAYVLAEDIKHPYKILKIPSEWEERAEKYIKTGSVLFVYFNDIDEILS